MKYVTQAAFRIRSPAAMALLAVSFNVSKSSFTAADGEASAARFAEEYKPEFLCVNSASVGRLRGDG